MIYVDDDGQAGNVYTFQVTIAPSLKRYYYVKDHLGSIRVTVNEAGGVVSWNDYDPWGVQLGGRNGTTTTGDRYKFTGKERDQETAYDYFGARYYDSRIARWLSVDPRSEKYPSWSPYNYVLGNPNVLVDPNGAVVDTLVFDTKGDFTGEVERDNSGKFFGKKVDERGAMLGSFSFQDPSDALSIISSKTRRPMSNNDGFPLNGVDFDYAVEMEGFVLQNLAAFNARKAIFGSVQCNTLTYPLSESFPFGEMDFITKFAGALNKRVAVIDGIAYNNFDASNYSWGMAMASLGYSPKAAQNAAMGYERVFKNRLDQSYDQMSIYRGARKWYERHP